MRTDSTFKPHIYVHSAEQAPFLHSGGLRPAPSRGAAMNPLYLPHIIYVLQIHRYLHANYTYNYHVCITLRCRYIDTCIHKLHIQISYMDHTVQVPSCPAGEFCSGRCSYIGPTGETLADPRAKQVSLSVSVCLSLSVCLSICLSVCLSVSLSQPLSDSVCVCAGVLGRAGAH